jgi:hypothetical protein
MLFGEVDQIFLLDLFREVPFELVSKIRASGPT